jgi:arylsulfatase A-like enzyme
MKEPITIRESNGRKFISLDNPSLQNLYSLYRSHNTASSSISDLGVGPNPKNIKKKIDQHEDALNIIFAPTPSTYVFETKIPDRGFIHFGYGLLPSDGRTSRNASFQVVVECEEEKETIFSSNLKTKRFQSNSRFDEKLSLEAYQGKSIKLYLKTQNISNAVPGRNEQELPFISYAFWYNPIIYQKIDKKRPGTNIILISLDTLRADHLGFSQYSRETSPNLDKLLDDSVVFSNCYSTAPSTLRSHMSLMTGLNPIRHQVYTQQDMLHPDIPTLADILRVNSYTSAAFTGGGRVSAVFGFAKGFDRYYENKSSWLDKDTPENLLEKGLGWLDNNRDKINFLFLHTYQPHDPYSNSSEYGQIFREKEHRWDRIELFKYLHQIESPQLFQYIPLTDQQKENIVALYDGEIRYTDECLIKPLVEALKKLEIYEKTMIIITSDHGEEFFEHGMWMHGGQLYNELIKVPLIIKYPYSKHKGIKVSKNVSLTDIVPTILNELNIEYEKTDFDGKDLKPLIRGLSREERYCFSEIPVKGNLGKVSVVHKKYKLIFNRIVFEDRFQEQAPSDELELYNLENDPGEKHNIANTEEEMVRYLMTKIDGYLRTKPKTKSTGEKTPVIDEELRKRLKALGYIE